MIKSKADQERNCRKSAYEILLMRSWKNQDQKRNDPSTKEYEHILNSLEGINFTNESSGQIFIGLKKHLYNAFDRLIETVKSDVSIQELGALIIETQKAQELSEIDVIVEKALKASQSLVR